MIACSGDAECDDGIFCNGPETCADGTCAAGTPPDCDDGMACSVDACDEAMRACSNVPPDADMDGYADAACGGDDCADTDATRHPGAVETCDLDDEDCDTTTLGDVDLDRDGFADAACCNMRSDGIILCGEDCDDSRRGVNPTTSEVCDEIDNDCDAAIDERVTIEGFVDSDRDLHGDPARRIRACAGAAGFSPVGDDCADDDPTRTGGPEICNALDDDCDGSVDEAASATTWYRDTDRDGFGNPTGPTMTSCAPLSGYSALDTDCDDSDPAVRPIAMEICNARDDDCDGRASFRVGDGDFEDDDHDGHPDAACAPGGMGDCDDRNPTVYPTAPELADGLDNDCDGTADGVCRMASWYPDADGDGFGTTESAAIRSCDPQPGRSSVAGDCDDASAARAPDLREVCNGVDDDCDAVIDEESDALCARAHALGDCRAGACQIALCDRAYGDCDSTVANGCELYLVDDPFNCGLCGAACTSGMMSTPLCTSGRCGLACALGFEDCDRAPANGCEIDVLTDVRNCGRCGNACSGGGMSAPRCDRGACTYDCTPGFSDCNGMAADGCETPTGRDVNNCGGCGMRCPGAGEICVDGSCMRPVFPSDGAEGDFAPTMDTVLSPGVHQFRSVVIPVGVLVTTTGAGVLEIRSQGDVLVAGTIDVSGARGGGAGMGGPGGGGATANPLAPGGNGLGAWMECLVTPGGGGSGTAGSQAPLAPGGCAEGGRFGGGEAGFGNLGGGGGGGYAGGGGGRSADGRGPGGGGDGGSAAGGAGGLGAPTMGCTPAEGGRGTGIYAGGNGSVAAGCQTGGGGGAIGADAEADLPVRMTMRPGSGGGAGGGGYASAGGGGGGGGGAVRIASATRIRITGAVLANGGTGGAVGCDVCGGGGGGSGGVVYLAAPSVVVDGEVSAGGGIGGPASTSLRGGAGGVGRVRISALAEECSLGGALTPPVTDCTARPATPGQTYVARYPN